MNGTRTAAPTPDEVASGYEHSAQDKIAKAALLRDLRMTEKSLDRQTAGNHFNFTQAEREEQQIEAEQLRQEALVEAVLALCARVAEVSR